MPRTKRTTAGSKLSLEEGSLISKHQLIVNGWPQGKLIAVVPKVKFGYDLLGDLRAHVQVCVRSAFCCDCQLKSLIDHLSQQSKEPDEVALSSAIGPSQDVQGAKFKVLQLPNGLKTFDRKLFNRFAHTQEDN